MSRKALLIFLMIFSTVVLLELLGLCLSFLQTGAVISLRDNDEWRSEILRIKPLRDSKFGTLVNNKRVQEEVIHPYLGYVHDPTVTPDRNELGFPLVKQQAIDPVKKQIVIGVFGGSFARDSAKYIQQALQNRIDDYADFADKQVVINTFALGGYKQPQQLLTLSYLLSMGHHFDVVINIDGFNEVALPPVENMPKNVSPFYPRNWYARIAQFDNELVAFRHQHNDLLDKRQWLAEVFSYPLIGQSYLLNLIWLNFDDILARKTAELQQKALKHKPLETLSNSYMVTGPKLAEVDNKQLYKRLAEHWAQSSRQMHFLASANDVSYLHFLQPNQYVAGSKPMGDAELDKAFTPNHPYQQGVEQGYPSLVNAGHELNAEGLAFHDLTMIFSNHEPVLYNDDCCHLNRDGYKLLANTVADHVLSSYSASARKID